jgi:putative tricarboxylic transport membrane protein
VTLSLIAFALLIRPAGLFIATAALALVARQAERGASLVRSVVLALALATLSAAIFVYAIGLPFRVWP